MEGPIAILMEEHRRIEKVLDVLDAYASHAVADDDVSRAELADIVLVIQQFADARHHGKEEDILFATMCEHGFPREMGPIAVMLHEHDEGRALVGALAEVASGEGPLDEDDRERVAEAARTFSALLRQHIMKEDQVLYPMAAGKLSAEVMASMSERFEESDRARDERDEWPKVRSLLARWT